MTHGRYIVWYKNVSTSPWRREEGIRVLCCGHITGNNCHCPIVGQFGRKCKVFRNCTIIISLECYCSFTTEKGHCKLLSFSSGKTAIQSELDITEGNDKPHMCSCYHTSSNRWLFWLTNFCHHFKKAYL